MIDQLHDPKAARACRQRTLQRADVYPCVSLRRKTKKTNATDCIPQHCKPQNKPPFPDEYTLIYNRLQVSWSHLIQFSARSRGRRGAQVGALSTVPTDRPALRLCAHQGSVETSGPKRIVPLINYPTV